MSINNSGSASNQPVYQCRSHSGNHPPDEKAVNLFNGSFSPKEPISSHEGPTGTGSQDGQLSYLGKQTKVADAIVGSPELGARTALAELRDALQKTDVKEGPTADQQVVFDKYGLSAEDIEGYVDDPALSESEKGAEGADDFTSSREGGKTTTTVDSEGNLVITVSSDDKSFGGQIDAAFTNMDLKATAESMQYEAPIVNEFNATVAHGFEDGRQSVTEDRAQSDQPDKSAPNNDTPTGSGSDGEGEGDGEGDGGDEGSADTSGAAE